MLYNANARATTRAQGDIFIEREANRKTIDDVTESMKRKLMSKPTTVYEEGVNFTFADKEYLDDMYKQDSHEGIMEIMMTILPNMRILVGPTRRRPPAWT